MISNPERRIWHRKEDSLWRLPYLMRRSSEAHRSCAWEATIQVIFQQRCSMI